MENQAIYKQLLASAKKTLGNSYSPYSKFKVAAALRTHDNHIFAGCNVENASYGLTTCAESASICNMISQIGRRTITEILVISSAQIVTMPCGACRQKIIEFSESSCHIYLPFGDDFSEYKCMTLEQILPFPFKLSIEDQ